MSDFRTEDQRPRNPAEPPRSYASDRGGQLAPDSRTTSGVVSFLSGKEREGRWQLPRLFRALAVMGNVKLDLRAAEIGYGVSVIEAVAVLGNIDITIPPEIAVECDGDSLLGSFVVKYKGSANPSSASRDRVVHVTGTAYAGTVTVRVKGPDEKMLAKIRRNLGIGG